jgi:hypothetical protein
LISYFYYPPAKPGCLRENRQQLSVFQYLTKTASMKRILLLSVSVLIGLALPAQTGPDPIISEYVEGWSNNKALELYNPTDTAIDLGNYRITRYSNGNTPPIQSDQWLVKLNGTLLPYRTRVIVIDQRDPQGTGQDAPVWDALQARADTFVCPEYEQSYALYFNGDDAVALEKLDGTMIDIFGKIGERPVNASGGTSQPTGGWTDTDPFNTGVGIALSVDHTLIRKPEISTGVNTPVDKFNILANWDSLWANTFTYLGWHDCDASPDTNTKPAFDPDSYSFNISIDDPTGTSVGTVSAADPNGDKLSYYITKGNSYDPFMIDRMTGEIKVAKTEELYWRDYTLTIDVTDGTSPVSQMVDIRVEGGYSGIRDISHGLEIFPNPVTGRVLQITAGEKITGVEVFNLTGKRIYSHVNAPGINRLDLELGGVESGLYMVRISFGDGSLTVRKVLLQ